MKVTFMTFALVLLVGVSDLTQGADTVNTSGATDAKLLTQTHDSKAAGTKHGDATKGGRPTTQAGTTNRP